MAVNVEHIKNIRLGDGVNTSFPFSFPVLEKEQIKCSKVLPNGDEVEISNTEFEVTINSSNVGGEIEYPAYNDDTLKSGGVKKVGKAVKNTIKNKKLPKLGKLSNKDINDIKDIAEASYSKTNPFDFIRNIPDVMNGVYASVMTGLKSK